MEKARGISIPVARRNPLATPTRATCNQWREVMLGIAVYLNKKEGEAIKAALVAQSSALVEKKILHPKKLNSLLDKLERNLQI